MTAGAATAALAAPVKSRVCLGSTTGHLVLVRPANMPRDWPQSTRSSPPFIEEYLLLQLWADVQEAHELGDPGPGEAHTSSSV